MNLGDLAFTAEDFNDSPDVEFPMGTADWANKILRAKLEKAQKLFCAKGMGHFDRWTENALDLDGSQTHTARLVCIEEVGG